MNDKLVRKMQQLILYLEIIVGIVIAIAVILGIPVLFKYIVIIITSSKDVSYETFSSFLRHVLILVVGLEMIMMILTHSHESTLTLVLFVIARKMLVYADSMFDIFIGTLSIAVIFIVFRFFTGDDKLLAKYDNTFSAAIPVEKIRREYGMKLPETNAKTLGGLIYELSLEEKIPIKEGIILSFGNYKLTVVAFDDGVIERILIEEDIK